MMLHRGIKGPTTYPNQEIDVGCVKLVTLTGLNYNYINYEVCRVPLSLRRSATMRHGTGHKAFTTCTLPNTLGNVYLSTQRYREISGLSTLVVYVQIFSRVSDLS